MKKSKKVTEYHFIDVNDPERYKKIKVSRACDFCRKRKSKCDLGVPGSGSCSNCKKTNIQCVFSSKSARKSSIQQFAFEYQEQHPNFSVDNQGLCAFEKDMSPYSHMNLTTVANSNLMDSVHLEVELFEVYFAFIHPFYPVLDSYKILETLKCNPNGLPPALKYSIMALALQIHLPATIENRDVTATSYYHYSLTQMDCTPCLSNIQTLLLMYKYEEIITPVGIPFSVAAIQHLKEAKNMIDQVTLNRDTPWTIENEFVCRAFWIWYINLSFSNLADSRCKEMLSLASAPTRLPSLTDAEHYDETSLNITCNFMHLISIADIYSQTTCYISNNATLFSSTDHLAFTKLISQLQVWLDGLPNQLRSGDTASLFSAHSIHLADDPSKTASFAVYLGLIHDTLGLLLTLHQKPFRGAQVALDLAVRAHKFTLADVPHLQFSRFASIQGSRLIVYGLTLALQALHYDIQESGVSEKMNPFMSMALQVLDQISVSSKLSLAIQDIKQYPNGRPTSNECISTFPIQPSDYHQQQEQTWNICQWEYAQDTETYQTRYEFSQDLKTPPIEQHISPCIVYEEENETNRLVAPMPFDIINPSFELYPSNCKRHSPL
ncbi:unnamed protein product [Rhizopus stolonifer]